MAKSKVIFHEDNMPCQKGAIAMGFMRDLKYKLLKHPPYSLNLATSDFYLFLLLAGKYFTFNHEAFAAMDQYFAQLP